MNRPLRLILAAATVYVSWIGMMAIHETGHVLAGLAGGGHIQHITIPLIGFSRTNAWPDPSPRLEVWGGPIVGSVIPLVLWLMVRRKLGRIAKKSLGFFTGLCLVVNGAYIGVGWTMSAGDAADLIKLGTPAWMLMVFGFPALACGFWIWHGLGRISDLLSPSNTLAGNTDQEL